jgi:hypothetical protein
VTLELPGVANDRAAFEGTLERAAALATALSIDRTVS